MTKNSKVSDTRIGHRSPLWFGLDSYEKAPYFIEVTVKEKNFVVILTHVKNRYVSFYSTCLPT